MFAGEINLLKALEKIRTPFLNGVFELLTMLGEETLLVVLIAVIYFMFDKSLAHRLFFVTVGSLGVNNVIKNIAKVPRPFAKNEITTVREHTATGYSFPSGHTQTISSWSTALAIRYRRIWLILFACLATLCVAFSRMYLGVHYPSDVIAGALLGVGSAFLLSFVFDRIKSLPMLYASALILLAPFGVAFMIEGNPISEDFYKIYGMLIGALCGTVFESRFVRFGYEAPIWKRIIRVVLGISAALIVKLLKFSDMVESVRLALALDLVRYFALVFVVMGIIPLLFKKLKI